MDNLWITHDSTVMRLALSVGLVCFASFGPFLWPFCRLAVFLVPSCQAVCLLYPVTDSAVNRNHHLGGALLAHAGAGVIGPFFV